MMQPSKREIFTEALQKDDAVERAAYLDEACGDDVELRQDVEELLAEHAKDGSFMVDKPPEVTVDIPVMTEKPGSWVGPYRLLEQVGEGGMGVVYMAEQKQPVKRRVALKIIKPGMDTRQVIARFEAERQALAMMDHPNIAKVFDTGATDSGRPYFVMELVNGIPITTYCDEQHLTTRERLELFIPVCQAVQHAHQKGIIHRDLKPGNILVALYDQHPVPKVIDFGVAKATTQTLTEMTLFTQLGQIVGTPQYMSPEQAQRNQLDIDTRSDIYSLGVVLYELLTGATPFEKRRLQSAAIDELMRIIREEDPPRPSARLSSIETLPSVAANRRIEPQKLHRLLRGELDWVVMKSLEKDRARRYETANGFAADIQRYLDNEAVVACPPSATYQLRKFARRNKTLLATASLIMTSLLLGLAGTSWQAIRATRAERQATEQKDVAVEARRIAQDETARATREATRADEKSRELEVSLRVANARRLAAQARNLREQSPVKSLLLGIEAVEATRRFGQPVVPIARQALLNTVAMVGGRPLVGHEARVRSALFTPDSRRAVTISHDATARVWDVLAADPTASCQVLRGHQGPIISMTVSRDGSFLVTGSLDGTVRVWDLSAESSHNMPIVLSIGTPVRSVTLGPKNRWLITGSGPTGVVGGDSVHLWDLAADAPAVSSRLLSDWMGSESPQISAEGRWVQMWSSRGVWLCDLTANDPADSYFVVGRGEVSRAASRMRATIGPDAQWLIAGDSDGLLRRWDLTDDGPLETVLAKHDERVEAVAISPDGRWLVAQKGKSDTVFLSKLDGKNEISLTTTLGSFPLGDEPVAFTADSTRLFVANREAVQVWDLTAEEGPSLAAAWSTTKHGRRSSVVIAPGDRWLINRSRNSNLVGLWDLSHEFPDKTEIVLQGHGSGILFTVASPDGRWLVTGDPEGSTRLWDIGLDFPASSLVLATSPGSAEFGFTGGGIATSADRRWLALVDSHRVARWDLSAENPSASMLEFPDQGRSIGGSLLGENVAISDDGRCAAAGTDSGIGAYVWQLNANETACSVDRLDAEIIGENGNMRSVALSPDGRWLVVAGRSWDAGRATADAHLWDLRSMETAGASIVLSGHKREVTTVRISRDSRWLATRSEDGVVRVWDLSSGNPASFAIELQGNPGHNGRLEFSADGRWLVASGLEAAEMWDLSHDDTESSSLVFDQASGARAAAVNASFYQVSCALALSPNIRHLSIASDSRHVHRFDLNADDPTSTALPLGELKEGVYSMTTSPNGRWLVAGDGKWARLWDHDSPDPAASQIALELRQPTTMLAAIGAGDRWLVTGRGGQGTGTLNAAEVRLGTSTQTLSLKEPAVSLVAD